MLESVYNPPFNVNLSATYVNNSNADLDLHRFAEMTCPPLYVKAQYEPRTNTAYPHAVASLLCTALRRVPFGCPCRSYVRIRTAGSAHGEAEGRPSSAGGSRSADASIRSLLYRKCKLSAFVYRDDRFNYRRPARAQSDAAMAERQIAARFGSCYSRSSTRLFSGNDLLFQSVSSVVDAC